jgi:hypothetical protein
MGGRKIMAAKKATKRLGKPKRLEPTKPLPVSVHPVIGS